MRSGFGIGVVAAFAVGGSAIAQAPALAPGDGQQAVQTACTSCHTIGIVTAHPHTADEWDEIIGKMIDKGLLASDQQLEEIAAYLAKNYAPPPATAGVAKREEPKTDR